MKPSISSGVWQHKDGRFIAEIVDILHGPKTYTGRQTRLSDGQVIEGLWNWGDLEAAGYIPPTRPPVANELPQDQMDALRYAFGPELMGGNCQRCGLSPFKCPCGWEDQQAAVAARQITVSECSCRDLLNGHLPECPYPKRSAA